MSNLVFTEFLKLLNDNIVDGELQNREMVQKKFEDLSNGMNNEEYATVVCLILRKLHLPESKNALELFGTKPKFKIGTYKKILRSEAQQKLDIHKIDRSNLLITLSRNITEDLKKYGPNYVLETYSKEIAEMTALTNNQTITYLIKTYRIGRSQCELSIRAYIRKFNSLYAEKFIKEFIDKKLEDIKKYFDRNTNVVKSIVSPTLSKQAFSIILLDRGLPCSNDIKNIIKDSFDMELDNSKIKEIINNIFDGKEQLNYKILGIDKILDEYNKENKSKLQASKSYNRLVDNFLFQINECQHLSIVIEAINDYQHARDYFGKLNISEKQLINEIIPIFKESNSILAVEPKTNKVKLISKDPLTPLEIRCLKLAERTYQKYMGLKSYILHRYHELFSKTVELCNNTNANVIFDDDNYHLADFSKLFDISKMISILKHINFETINRYNNETINQIKRYCINEGLVSSVMLDGIHLDIATIINHFPLIFDNTNGDILQMTKQTELFTVTNDFVLDLLTPNVTKKIIISRQLLQSNTIDDVKFRLDKAVDLMCRSRVIDGSTIPFDIDVTYKGIRIERYRNDDVEILTSGIDTNTCFKIGSNDNDFLFYTILNKNGLAFKILDSEGKLLGRATAFRNENIFYINGIRSSVDVNEEMNLEDMEQNKIIFEAFLELSRLVIEKTSDHPVPIDYVICNKAGILEASELAEDVPTIPEHIVKNPIDTYNADWKEFVHLFDEYPRRYLSEVIPDDSREIFRPFTTDFSHYPALQLATREPYDFLDSLRKIDFQEPEATYTRPRRKIITAKLSDNDIKTVKTRAYQIAAMNHYVNVCKGNFEMAQVTYNRPDFIDVSEIIVGEDWFVCKDVNGFIVRECIIDRKNYDNDLIKNGETLKVLLKKK